MRPRTDGHQEACKPPSRRSCLLLRLFAKWHAFSTGFRTLSGASGVTRKSTAPEIGQIRAAPDMLPAAPFLNSLTGHGSTSATLQRPRFMRRVVHCHQRSQTTQSRPRNRGDSWIQISVSARAISRFPFWLPFWLTNCTQSGTPKWTRIRIAPGVLRILPQAMCIPARAEQAIKFSSVWFLGLALGRLPL